MSQLYTSFLGEVIKIINYDDIIIGRIATASFFNVSDLMNPELYETKLGYNYLSDLFLDGSANISV